MRTGQLTAKIRGAVVNALPAPGEHVEPHELAEAAGRLLGHSPKRYRSTEWRLRVLRAVDALADEGRVTLTDAGLVEVV